MTHRHRTRFPLLGAALAVAAFLVTSPAFPSGFQIMTQGARATGMGLAFTAVADDPSAIFYNPAGLGWIEHYEGSIGGSLLTRVKGDFAGENPYPGNGVTEHYRKQSFLLPTVYAVAPLTRDLKFGLGVFAPYGLGLRWENPENCGGNCATNPVLSSSFSGRFLSQNAVIQTTDVNPVVSFRIVPQLAIAAGADLRFSKVQLERNQAAFNPLTSSAVDVAHIKLNSDLTSNHGWGWNVGLLFKPMDMFSIGAAYRSKITVDYEGKAKFTQRLTGNAAFDAAVAASLPTPREQKVTTSIEFPATVNLGVAVQAVPALTISVEADWTQWSTFRSLDILFPDLPTLGIHRPTLWKDSWAYRGGLDYKVTKEFAVRAGYYYDKTPQPAFDVGPILSDNNRNVYTIGLGYNTERWGVDIGDAYIRFKDRDARSANTDKFFGVYKEVANVGSINLRFAF